MVADAPSALLGAPGPRTPRRALASAWRQLREQGARHVLRRIGERARLARQVQRYDWNLRRCAIRLDRVPIDRPIFLLGVQGGGGTIVARTLYRHPRAVYASGNSAFWAGLDEIHNCHHTIRDLPEALIHRSAHFFNVDGRLELHPHYGYQRSWLYAIDEFLSTYARDAGDADEATAAALKRVIRKCVLAYAHDPGQARFVDMSQLYTIQVSFLAELLRDCAPRFILLARNPYVTCARAARKEYETYGTRVVLSPEQKLQCAIEHWSNSYRRALSDGRGLPMLRVRYEDFIDDPRRVVRTICEFAELDFDPRQVPGPGQPMPLGSVSPEKWYPLKREENARYADALSPDLIRGLNRKAGDVIRELGYEVLG